MKRYIAAILAGLMTLAAASAPARSPDPWNTGLGQADGACLAFLFEVTFMKIDVAEMEAWLDAATAAEVSAARRDGKDLEDRVADILLAADEIVFRMEFARGGGYGKFRKGMNQNLEAGRKHGLIDEEGERAIQAGLDRMLAPLEEREAVEGDAILYHVTPDSVRMAYFDPEGQVLFDDTFTDGAWPSGIKGLFLARDSGFREKWGKSLDD